MAYVGDSSLWSDFFPEGLIPIILELIISTWAGFEKPTQEEHEEPISRRFREELRRSKDKHYHPFSIWPESSETDPVTGKEIGRIDLRFLHGHKEDVYFAFECKRLRIPRDSGTTSNAGEYVGKDGMMCFVTGKYSKTQHAGGMIGYVMDGDIKKAIASIKRSIVRKKHELCIANDSGLHMSSLLPKEKLIKETNHFFDSREFTIHHIFLGIS